VKVKRLFSEVLYQVRFALPIWFLRIITFWWPDNRFTIRLRGMLHKPFIGKVGKGFKLASGVILLNTHKMELGDNVYFSYDVWLNALGGFKCGDHVILGPRVCISTLSHVFSNGNFATGGATFAPVTLGDGVWLAANVSVKSGVEIKKSCVVGANSTVVTDLAELSFASGVPARVISKVKEKKVEQDQLITSRSGL
jgi:acetyltransferase-like isoleucine patch superfamily enzyme